MLRLVLAGVFAMVWQTAALADIYKCVDAQGRVTYTNDKSSSRGCIPLSSDLPVSSIPPVTRPQPQAAPSGHRAGRSRVLRRIPSASAMTVAAGSS